MDRQSRLWKTACHEAGHCLIAILDRIPISYAIVRGGYSGEVRPEATYDMATGRIAVAGAAAMLKCGFTWEEAMERISGDREILRKTKLGGSHQTEGELDYTFRRLMQDVGHQIDLHRPFVEKLADHLYRNVGHKVSGDQILQLWEAYQAHCLAERA
jgi:hypothetical protein